MSMNISYAKFLMCLKFPEDFIGNRNDPMKENNSETNRKLEEHLMHCIKYHQLLFR
jgi:hypothetical protein